MSQLNHETLPPLEVVFWGNFACFTRPEAKAERVTYPVPTPSAMRGTLEQVFWKPEFRYRIREIRVLKPIQYISFLRNEVTSKMPNPKSEVIKPIDIADKRTQRLTLALKDVAYHVLADIVLRSDVTDDPAKYRDQFRRRIERGQCFSRPVLGCREFAANFAAPRDYPGSLRPIPRTQKLGLMLFDIAFASDSDANAPLFFEAELTDGCLIVPEIQYELLTTLSAPWQSQPRPTTANLFDEETNP